MVELQRARSLLYRSRFLQSNTTFLKHFSRSIRFTHLRTAPKLKYSQNFLKLFRILVRMFAKDIIFQRVMRKFPEFWQNLKGIIICKDSNDSVARQPNLSALVFGGCKLLQSIDALRAMKYLGELVDTAEVWRVRGSLGMHRRTLDRSLSALLMLIFAIEWFFNV